MTYKFVSGPYRKAVVFACAFLAGIAGSVAQAAHPPEIWFTPLQNAVNPSGHGVTLEQHDFRELMQHPEQWKLARSRIAEMTLDIPHFVENRSDLPAIVNWSNKQSFKIGASGSIVYTDHQCDPHIEGVTNDTGFAHEIALTVHGWKLAGGRLDYFIMDSPLVFGHYVALKQCHLSIEDVARRSATTVQMILQDYPDAKIVDAEGPGEMRPAAWLPEYYRFVTAFQQASGRPISYLSMDMHWFDAWHTGYNWVKASRQIISFAHAHGIKAALIINANDKFVVTKAGIRTNRPVTEESWMQANRDHMQIAHDEGLPLDAIIINCWTKFPKWNLPESNPNAYTSLVDAAARIWSSGPS